MRSPKPNQLFIMPLCYIQANVVQSDGCFEHLKPMFQTNRKENVLELENAQLQPCKRKYTGLDKQNISVQKL